MATNISLPSRIYESHLTSFLDQIGAGDAADSVELDFSQVEFWTPGAFVALLAKMDSWQRAGKVTSLINHEKCPAFGYLQRIDFFSNCGLTIQEGFQRHHAGKRFVELRKIGSEDGCDVAELSTDIADCLFPEANVADPDESGLFDLLQYSVSEMANNVVQHAKGPGFASAQYTGRTDLIRVAIADSGIGVLRSFSENGSPFYKSEWTDSDAITTALQPKISSKLHLKSAWGEPINAGVGLSLLRAISLQTGGDFFIASGGSTLLQSARNANLPPRLIVNKFQGTLCAMSFVRAKISNFHDLMYAVKSSVGLLRGGDSFDTLFS